MFDQIDFEQKFYTLIVNEVNAAYSKLINDSEGLLQIDLIKQGLKMQRQIIASLHSITEESVMQMSFGLLAYKQSTSDNFQLTGINDMNLGEQGDE